MSDDLMISGSGSTAVATDELFAAAQMLSDLAALATQLRSELATIDDAISMDWLSAGGAPAPAARAELDLDQARTVMAEIEVEARALSWALGVAADGYGFVESFIQSMGINISSEVVGVLGSVSPGAIMATPFMAGLIAGIAGGMGAGGAIGGGTLSLPRSAPSSFPSNVLVTSPGAAAIVRGAVMSADDGVMGVMGVPRPVAKALLDGAGVGGLPLASTALARAGSAAGLLRETDVALTDERSRHVVGGPDGFAERLNRVPQPSPQDPAQVVVEKYTTPGQADRFEVYIAGTVSFDPVATTEPWDMTSNVSNAAGEGSGSYAAVAEAMRLAGVDGSSPVVFTGYSQGGATAALLAASGDYNTQGLATFGAPTGQIAIPSGFPTVLVEHADDIVPAFGGTQDNRQAVIVERAVFAGREIPTDVAVPAHHLEYYGETASLMDAAKSDQLVTAAAQLGAFGAHATSVTSTAYCFERVGG